MPGPAGVIINQTNVWKGGVSITFPPQLQTSCLYSGTSWVGKGTIQTSQSFWGKQFSMMFQNPYTLTLKHRIRRILKNVLIEGLVLFCAFTSHQTTTKLKKKKRVFASCRIDVMYSMCLGNVQTSSNLGMAANSLLKSGIAKQWVISHLPPPSHSTLSGVYLKPEQVGLFIWDVLVKAGLVIVLRTTAVLQYHLCPEVDVWVTDVFRPGCIRAHSARASVYLSSDEDKHYNSCFQFRTDS